MSLLCGECSEAIGYGLPLRAVDSGNVRTAICPKCMNKIPKGKFIAVGNDPEIRSRGTYPIHRAISDRNINGAYTIFDFTVLEIMFVLSDETIAEYWPRLHRQING